MEVWLCGPGMSREKDFESLKTLYHFQFSRSVLGLKLRM